MLGAMRRIERLWCCTLRKGRRCTVRVMRDKIAVVFFPFFFLAPFLFCVTSFFVAAKAVSAQDTAILMPDQSTAKAKQIIQQATNALGGSAYLDMRDFTCTGSAGQFGHSGE